MLRVNLFGAPGFVYADHPFTVNRAQNRALLYRLASDLRPVARAELAFLFWPDEPDAHAQRLLTKLLSQVRASLPSQDLLLVTKDAVQLDGRHATSDCADFARLHGDGDSSDSLALAIDLYRSPFLVGASLPNLPEFEVWVEATRSRYELMYLGALRVLLNRRLEQEQWRRAIDLARRYLAVDQLAEDVHRHLIQAHTAVGERSEAIQQYERCKSILMEELGVSPLPETSAAYEAVLMRGAAPKVTPTPPPLWATLPEPQAPLVGRNDLLEKFAATLQQVTQGQGQFILLRGEAGIGKSRLLRELSERTPEGTLRLAAACHPNLQPLPYQPLVEMLRSLLHQPHLLRRVPSLWLRPLCALIPELEQIIPEVSAAPSSIEPQRARAMLFEAILQTVIALTGDDGPALIYLDDLHWADSATLDRLMYIAPLVAKNRLLICATYRSDEAEAIGEFRWALGRAARYSEWEMPALNAGETRQLFDLLGVPSTGVLIDYLQTATGGNVFFLLETVQGLLESGQLMILPTRLAALPVSATMVEAIDRRLARLQPVARQLLEAGAVLGISFSFLAAREVAGRSEMEALDGLDELLRRHILVEDNDGYRFNHEVAQSVIYRQLSQWRRRILHRRCAELLETTLDVTLPSYRAALVAQIGSHYAEANEPAKAVNYLLEAGDHARNLYDHQAAISYYQQAMTSLRDEGESQRAARVLMKLGLTYHTALDYEAAHAAFDEAFRLFQHSLRRDSAAPVPAAPHALRIASASSHLFSFDPAEMAIYETAVVGMQIFSGLVQVNPQLDIAPDIAQRWEVLDRGRKYLFHLRTGVQWSDGHPVTAHDFSYSWKRALGPENIAPSVYLLYEIRNARAYHEGIAAEEQVGVKALDDYTLEVELEVPAPYFLYTLLYSSFLPVPRHIVNQMGDDWAITAQPVTNGAFRPQTWQRADALVLERNHRYQGNRSGNIEQVCYYTNADWAARLRLYRANQLDVLHFSDPPTPEMDEARRLLAADYMSIPMLAVDFLAFNTAKPPFDDVRVRQALGLAIDKELLANVVLHGYRAPAHGGFVPPGMPGHTPHSAMPYDPARARKLLAAAGFPDGRGFPPVEWYAGMPEFQPFADFVCNQWREHLNLDLPYVPAQWEELFRRIYTAPPPLFVMTWYADYPDPHTFLGNGPVQHYCKWQDEVYDLLLADASVAPDQSSRLELYQQLDRMLLEEGIVFPLTYMRHHLLVKPWVKLTPFSLAPNWFWKDAIITPH